MKPLLWLLVMMPWLVSAQPGPSETVVHERRLDNGLQIYVKPDRRAPIVSSQVWYRVGSSYEHGGITGISHVLEHMMFKGTERLAPGAFSRTIAEHGGDENAFTSRDYTAYFQNLAKDRLAISFELEADRMANLALSEEEFLKELEVVKEERRLRTDDNPEALTFEIFNATAYVASPYRYPVIGWADDIEQLTVADLRAWYDAWYGPNNAALVVVGDVDPAEVFALAEEHFGSVPPIELAGPKPRAEPEQRGEKRVQVQAPAKEPYLLMGYKATVVGHADEDWEPYALEVLAAVLDGGNSARLERELVRGRQVAASASAGYNAFTRLPGMLLLSGVPASGYDVADLEQALRDQIRQLQQEPVSESELERILQQVIAGKVYERDSVFFQGMQIGQFFTAGLDWRLLDEYLTRLQAVTPEQIQTVARRYLIPDNLTVAWLDPQPIAGQGPSSEAGDDEDDQ
ncbi:pitrilysin family protein [Thioalkalicoccus limnaeus]|uniref:Pitrilysin family protein n=1 Tax=Thioalkalicoccus limnaeus TaxID=120681 RepID=A0ABV4BAD0_9GAMM